jgi:signal transduction histidine kinase
VGRAGDGFKEGATVKILIVDDDPSLQQMLDITFGLDERVSAVQTTGTPAEAVAVATDFQPDVVVVDSVLEHDGSEVGQHLRSVVPGARLISFSGMEREAPWADARVLKSGDGIEELKREIFGDAAEGDAPTTATIEIDYDELRTFFHDVRNPIGAIVGFAHILKTRDDRLSEEQLEKVVDALERTAERLSNLVETFADEHRRQAE